MPMGVCEALAPKWGIGISLLPATFMLSNYQPKLLLCTALVQSWETRGRGGGGERVCSAASVYTAQYPTYHVIIATVGNSYQARGTREITFPLRVGPVEGFLHLKDKIESLAVPATVKPMTNSPLG